MGEDEVGRRSGVRSSVRGDCGGGCSRGRVWVNKRRDRCRTLSSDAAHGGETRNRFPNRVQLREQRPSRCPLAPRTPDRRSAARRRFHGDDQAGRLHRCQTRVVACPVWHVDNQRTTTRRRSAPTASMGSQRLRPNRLPARRTDLPDCRVLAGSGEDWTGGEPHIRGRGEQGEAGLRLPSDARLQATAKRIHGWAINSLAPAGDTLDGLHARRSCLRSRPKRAEDRLVSRDVGTIACLRHTS